MRTALVNLVGMHMLYFTPEFPEPPFSGLMRHYPGGCHVLSALRAFIDLLKEPDIRRRPPSPSRNIDGSLCIQRPFSVVLTSNSVQERG
jgi:hypothetical protein